MARLRRLLTEGPVRPMAVVVLNELFEQRLEMTPIDDEHPVEVFAADCADETLGEGVGPWSTDRRADGSDLLRPKDFIEAGGELGVPVPD